MTVVDWNEWRSRTKHNTEQLSELGDTNRFFLGCPYIVKAVSSLHTDQNINDSTSRLNNGLSWFQKLCRKSAEEHNFLSQSPCPFAPAGLYYLIHKVYNRFDSRNVPLLEDIGTFFGYTLLSRPKPGELSVLRDGWPSHGPVDFRARPSWVWAGKLNIPERLQAKLLDYEKDLKKYGSDLEILRANRQVFNDHKPPKDIKTFSDGYLKLKEMIDDGLLIPISDEEELELIKSREFVSQIIYIPVLNHLNEVLKLRIVGDDGFKNRLTNLKLHGMSLHSHRELFLLSHLCMNPNFTTPLLQGKADLKADIAREKLRRAADEARHWSQNPMPPKRAPIRTRGFIPVYSKIDLRGAYFQNPLRLDSASNKLLHLYRYWNADLSCWCYCYSSCFSFGNRHSAYSWCYVSSCIETTLNYMGIPCSCYVDDFILLLPPHLVELGFSIALKVFEGFGLSLSKKDMGVVMGSIGLDVELLGLNYRTDFLLNVILGKSEPVLSIECPEGKLNLLTTEIAYTITRLRMAKLARRDGPPVKQYQRIAGIITFIVWNSKVRKSLPELRVLWQVNALSDDDYAKKLKSGDKLISDLITALDDILQNIPLLRECRDTWLSDAHRDRATLYTDAMLNDSHKLIFFAGVGGILLLPDGSSFAFSFIFKKNEVPLWAQNWCIMEWELYAQVVAFMLWSNVLQSCQPKVHLTSALDNMPSGYCLVNQWSRRLLSDILVRLIHKHVSTLDLHVYFTWISTKRNTSDELSRLIHVSAENVGVPSENFSSLNPFFLDHNLNKRLEAECRTAMGTPPPVSNKRVAENVKATPKRKKRE